MGHANNLSADRELGEYWERQFCEMAADIGFVFTPMQIGRSSSIMAFTKNGHEWKKFTLPDITVWTAPGQHHEIKHKNPTSRNSFGLEKYRFDALLDFSEETKQDIMYTIHNHDLSGGRNARTNNISQWITANVKRLEGNTCFTQSNGVSYINGKRKLTTIYYWPASLWVPLAVYWGIK